MIDQNRRQQNQQLERQSPIRPYCDGCKLVVTDYLAWFLGAGILYESSGTCRTWKKSSLGDGRDSPGFLGYMGGMSV